MEIAIKAKQKIAVSVAPLFGRSGNDGDAARDELRSEAGAALGIDGWGHKAFNCVKVKNKTP